jgi:peptidylprolyl isomerase
MKALAFSLLLAAAPLVHAESGPVVGRIGDIEITTAELRESLAGLEASSGSPLAKDSAAVSQYLRALLIQRQVLKLALDEKWDQQPAVIARLVRARESALTESFLEAKSAPDADYPSDEELRKAYGENKDKLVIPKSWQLAQIYISIAEDADKAAEAAAKAKLDAIIKQLATKDADFAAIARKSSEEPASASQGGLIGWLAQDQIQPEIREKLPKLALGETTGPVRLKDGWHIVKVLDIREARTPALDEVRDQLAANLRAAKARANRQQLIAELLEKHPPAINEIELMKLP